MNASNFNLNLDNFGIMGDSAGADLSIWVALKLAEDVRDGVNTLPPAKFVFPIYSTLQNDCLVSGILRESVDTKFKNVVKPRFFFT